MKDRVHTLIVAIVYEDGTTGEVDRTQYVESMNPDTLEKESKVITSFLRSIADEFEAEAEKAIGILRND